jgi:dTDP-4-dehydrorhamnose reductase
MKKLKILLLGKNGQVGWELQRSLLPLGELIAWDSQEANLLNPDDLSQKILKLSPDIIVHAAAHTAVDKAETTESDRANLINAVSVKILAETAKQIGALLVFYSTDYVFDGSGSHFWKESDCPNPLNIYGLSKLKGEKNIQESGCDYLIFRTSWVYAARGNNFAKTILKLAQEREFLKIIDDQIGAPTGADLIADITAHCIRMALENPKLLGLYHLVPDGEVSWYGYAKYLLELAEKAGLNLKSSPNHLIPIPANEYPLPSLRPKNSRLSTDKLRESLGLDLPDWRVGVERFFGERFNSFS